MRRKQVNNVFMGAHSIFVKDNKPQSFVNTCGSMLITNIAKEEGIPVYVIGEMSKLVALTPEAIGHVSFDEEEEIFTDVAKTLTELKSTGQKVRTLNIGYDLCEFLDNVELVTEA